MVKTVGTFAWIPEPLGLDRIREAAAAFLDTHPRDGWRLGGRPKGAGEGQK
jgi:hypothetical protein